MRLKPFARFEISLLNDAQTQCALLSFATKPTLRYSASKKAMRSECTHMGTYFELKCTHLRNMAALNG